jgi:hypothetical protein
MMDLIDNLVAMLDGILNTRRKRHIVGGVLISTSLLFGGLAPTTFTIKDEEE